MRAFLVVLLGGALVWWVATAVTSSDKGGQDDLAELEEFMEPPAPSAPKGQMMRRRQPAAATPTEVLEPAPGPESALQGATTEAADDALNPVEGGAPVAAQDDGDGPEAEPLFDADEFEFEQEFSDPAELAGLMLHYPEELPGYFQEQGEALSGDRKRLVMAFAQAIAGRFDRAREHATHLRKDSDITSAEEKLLRRMLQGKGEGWDVAAREASLTRENPLLQAASMGWLARIGDELIKDRDFVRAAGIFSELLQEEIASPWAPDKQTLRVWSAALSRAQARHRWDPGGDWPSVEVTVEPGDSLVAIRKRVIAERPGLKICTGLIRRANALGTSTIQPGTVLRIPTDPVHVLVDLDARWMFYMHGTQVVAAWEVGIGKQGSETRPGLYTVGEKTEEPTWFRRGQDPIPFGDPENLLGTRWIAWVRSDGGPCELGFHGTSDPDGVGARVSSGCIRMHNESVEELFEVLPRESEVEVQS